MKKARSEFAIKCQKQTYHGRGSYRHMFEIADAADFVISVAIEQGPEAAITAIQETLPMGCWESAARLMETFVDEVRSAGGVLPSHYL